MEVEGTKDAICRIASASLAAASLALSLPLLPSDPKACGLTSHLLSPSLAHSLIPRLMT